MQAKIIVFSKITDPNNVTQSATSQIVFAVTTKWDHLIDFDLAKHSPDKLASDNAWKRHGEFDWYANRFQEKIFLFEVKSPEKDLDIKLPLEILLADKKIPIVWYNFPATVRHLGNPSDRNKIQLAVQYLSSGTVDESVIAADFDYDFIKSLLEAEKAKEKDLEKKSEIKSEKN